MELQDSTVCFLYDQLRVETIRYLEDYIRSERGTLAELKDRFRRSLPEEDRRRVRTVKKLVDTLEERSVIGPNNVELLKMLAEALELQKLKDKIEEFETKCAGIFQRTLKAAGSASGFIWQKFKGGVCTSAIRLKTVLSIKGVPILAGAALMYIYNTNPEKLKDLQPFLDFGAQVIALLRGSVVFVLKVSSISSLKRLWQSYKDGSFKENLKKYFNETKELKEVSQGEEIDVEVTIDEEEYREVLWDLILLEVKGNSTKNTKRQRRHSVCCERDVPDEESSKPVDVTQIQIRVGRPIMELGKSIDSIKRLKKRLAKGLSKTAECEEERLSEIRRQLSEMEIFLAAASFSDIRLKEAAEKIRRAEDFIPFRKEESSISAESGLQSWESLSDFEAAPSFSDIRFKETEKRRPYTPLMKEISSADSGLQNWESSSTCSSEDNEKAYKPIRKIQLRKYQKELAAPALEGKNTIIYAPNNNDKKFVAMEIAKRHLDDYKIPESNEVKRRKVIFVVDMPTSVSLQQSRFEEYLSSYSISGISKRFSDVNPPNHLIQDNDVIVLTPQILLNFLENKSFHITDISLLMFDECHHAKEEHPYNEIMQAYLKTKLYERETKTLPQVVGLTASLGTNTTNKEQVLQMCANLDASNISTVRKNMKRFGGQVPVIKRTSVQKKPGNIFEKEINKNMEEIENFLKKTPQTMDREVESYRQWIKALESDADKSENRDHFICAQQLRRYHEALLINGNVRTEDAILYLDEYFNGLDKSKFNETESWLQELFLKTKERIEKHIQEAGMPENPHLIALQKHLIDFQTTEGPRKWKAKGILIARSRDFAYALKRWMEETEELKEILKPKVLTADCALAQQEQVIKNFKEGKVNIIIATTVTEEGLDIPDCSYCIRYGMLGNEITSVHYRIRTKKGKRLHQYKKLRLQLVLGDINGIPTDEFQKMIKSLQIKSVASEKETPTDADGVTFYCRKCNALVCNAQDIRRFENVLHVIINKEIYERINIKPHQKPKTLDGIYFGKKIYCKICGHDWGVIVTFKGTEWPCLKVASLVTTLNHGKVKKLFKKWKDLPFKICEATLEEMMTKREKRIAFLQFS